MQSKSPKLAQRFLLFFLREDLKEEVLGDLEEKFYIKLEESSAFRAKLNYWYQVLHYLRPFAIRNFQSTTQYPNHYAMYKNHFKIAWRSLQKNKLFSLLNITGLATGMACTLCIYLWVNHELSFDKFHKHIDELYFVEILIDGWDNSVITPAPLASSLVEEYPNILNASRFSYFGDGRLLSYEDKSFKEKGIEVDTSFFEMFTFQFKQGNAVTPFSNLESIILTEHIADKYFGELDPIGKVIKLDNDKEYIVSGILENIPDNSSFQFDFVIPFKPYSASNPDNKAWGAWFCATIVLLNEHTTGEELINKTSGFKGLYDKVSKPKWSSQLIPMADVYFHDRMQPFLPKSSDIKHIQIFSIAGILIFIVTCINYMSLSTSQFVRQFKQVGVRKILGAGYRDMASQYFIEALIFTAFSLVVAILMMEFFQPLLTRISGKALSVPILDAQSFLLLIGLILLTSMIACSFPIFFLRTLKPIISLQNVQGIKPGGISFRKSLVIFQFAITTCLIICTLVLQKQLQFIQNKDVGYQKENLISVDLPEEIAEKIDVIKNELLRHPLISSVSRSTFESIYFDTKISEWEGKTFEESLSIRPMTAGTDFLKTFAIEIEEGRFYESDVNDSTALVINQTAAKKMGLSSPIGKKVQLPWEQEKRTIIGVVKDFNYWELTKEIEPLFVLEGNSGNLYARINEDNKQQILAYMRSVFEEVNPAYPFDYSFLEDRYQVMHASQYQTGTIFKVFAGVSIIISCLSLFAMASFTAARRTKEIGIRKVNGASTISIVQMLSKVFLKLVLTAFTIAVPIAWFIMHQWLQDFAYRIALTWGIFVVSGVGVLLITLLTVSFQTIKAALANPVNSLRSE